MAVSLGLPGDWAAPEDAPDAYASRVGGQLCLPKHAAEIIDAGNITCHVCNARLSLLMQCHAPVKEAQAGLGLSERLVFLFGCTEPECGSTPGSWRAFRYQAAAGSHAGHTSNSPAAATVTALAGRPPPTAAPPAAAQPDSIASWGGDGDWGAATAAAPGGAQAQLDPMSFADLDAALSAAFGSAAAAAPSAAKAPKPQPRHRMRAEPEVAAAAAAAAGDTVRLPSGPPLPEFYLDWREESAAAPDLLRPQDAQHIAELVDRYRANNDMEVEGPAGEAWAGEAYERDTLPGGDAAFPKFSKRLQRCPQQCVRYSWGGSPIWPAASPPEAKPCSACGASRTFELQAMPALHHALGDGLAWNASKGRSSGRQHSGGASVDGWSWLTVAVFSCSKSCDGQGGGQTWAEEQVAFGNE